MNHLELSVEREIELMTKTGLTAEELFVARLILYAQDNHPEYISQFFSQNGKTIDSLRDILVSLQSKGIINKSYKVPSSGNVFKPNDVDFNKNAIKEFYHFSQDLGMELFENYPAFITINDRQYSLRNITKLYKSFDEMCFAYAKEIKFSLDKHKEVMELLQYAKDNNLIKSGICDFIASHQWLTIQELQDGNYGTFNTNTLI